MDSTKDLKTNYTYIIIKRIIDIISSSVAIILFFPLLVLIAILIKLGSPGPVFFKQTRIGENGHKFNFLRFRTMKYGMDDEPIQLSYLSKLLSGELGPEKGDSALKLSNDPRMTRIGKYLRAASLDEVPQLINVLMGDMSMVGPRPAIPYEIGLYDEWHKGRLKARPGITGLWQVSGKKELTFDEMVLLDLQYINKWSLWLDIKILIKTPWMVLTDQV